jgi:hypothetical protein
MSATWPVELRINAWAGAQAAASPVDEDQAGTWALGEHATVLDHKLFADEPPDPRNWEDPRVGWGLVLADSHQDDAVKIACGDAPEPIQELRRQRSNAPIFRYDTELGDAYLRVYEQGMEPYCVGTAGSNIGTESGELPQYLLIVGSPDQIPWSLQYALNTSRFVGRIDLDELGLERYVGALLSNWAKTTIRSEHPLLWSDDLGTDDITWLMRYTIAESIREALEEDSTVHSPVLNLAKEQATRSGLREALQASQPALIVTTSHGWTPHSQKTVVDGDERRLGAPVDHASKLATADYLMEGGWQPNGAIWYSHACCSAGTDKTTDYAGVVKPGSTIDETLQAAASLGAISAELPRRLLSAEKPLAAFIGQVEPTFNWTLQDSVIGQVTTSDTRHALYDSLFRRNPEPIGMAMRSVYKSVGTYWQNWRTAKKRATQKGDSLARATAAQAQLAAIDRQSTVVLGDPTVTIPAMLG